MVPGPLLGGGWICPGRWICPTLDQTGVASDTWWCPLHVRSTSGQYASYFVVILGIYTTD